MTTTTGGSNKLNMMAATSLHCGADEDAEADLAVGGDYPEKSYGISCASAATTTKKNISRSGHKQ